MTLTQPSSFPLRTNKNLIQRLFLFTGILMIVLSSICLIFPENIYPDQDMLQSFLVNDLINIIIGLPIFLVSLWLIKRERFLGWLLLPGALVYVAYNYLAYLFGRPFDIYALFYLVLVMLSSCTLVYYLRSVDHHAVKEQLKATVPIKIPAWVLIIFGAGFFLLACYQIINGLMRGIIPPLGEYAVSLADIVVSTLWTTGGIALLRKRPIGYTLGLGLLFVTCSLFIGLILFFFLAPVLTDRPFEVMEVIQILIMGLIGFVPTALFWRGVVVQDPK